MVVAILQHIYIYIKSICSIPKTKSNVNSVSINLEGEKKFLRWVGQVDRCNRIVRPIRYKNKQFKDDV